ncbi:MAG: hypothetical protein KDI09_13105 [Halioglobus sp.]|nr:hypothetical protein [Halioglobus sp.]
MSIAFARLILVAVLLSNAYGACAQTFDIVGLSLGMTETQARTALKAHGVDPNLQEQRQHYAYSDGVNHGLTTEDFLYTIDAERRGDTHDALTLYFSPGPAGGRVVAIARRLEMATGAPTRRQYVEALVKKYGTPVEDDGNTLRWQFPAEKIQCIAGAVGSYSPTQPSILKKLYGANVGSRDGVFHNRAVTSLDDCASYLSYALPSGDDSAVTQSTALLVDVAATAEGELAAAEWVAGLAEQARLAREGQGAVPAL